MEWRLSSCLGMTSEMSLLIYALSITDHGKTCPCVLLTHIFVSSQIVIFLASAEYPLLLGQFNVNIKHLCWYYPGSCGSVAILWVSPGNYLLTRSSGEKLVADTTCSKPVKFGGRLVLLTWTSWSLSWQVSAPVWVAAELVWLCNKLLPTDG